MKIAHIPPPNYKEIRKHLPAVDFERGTIFVYGDTCYSAKPIGPDIGAHEEVHVRQQKSRGWFGPRSWWKKYLRDPQFRFEQELEAYQAQWQYVEKFATNRDFKAERLHSMCSNLSGPLYGNLITFEEAKRAIVHTKRLGD